MPTLRPGHTLAKISWRSLVLYYEKIILVCLIHCFTSKSRAVVMSRRYLLKGI